MRNRRISGRRLLIVLVAVCLSAVSGCVKPSVQHNQLTTIVPWKQNAAPAAWNPVTHDIIYNGRGSDGLWDAYSARPDGSNVRCITCDIPGFASVKNRTQRGASDVSPDGKYLLLHIEKAAHQGRIGVAEAEPGKGVYSDVWLASADGTQSWQLTDVPASGDNGTMWARFDRTGKQLVWAEMYKRIDLKHMVGQWRLKIGRISWSKGTPTLVDVRTYEPETGKFYEPYGFSADNKRIIFASDVRMPAFWDSQIWTISTNLTDLKRISPADAATGFFRNYNEFAYYMPGRDRIIFARTRNATKRGMDYWSIRTDGSDMKRLTTMNEPNSDQSKGYAIAGGLAFDPQNPDRFIAGVAKDLLAHNLSAFMITLKE
jgi:hypothetical protein